jgi:hypothetical protein
MDVFRLSFGEKPAGRDFLGGVVTREICRRKPGLRDLRKLAGT